MQGESVSRVRSQPKLSTGKMNMLFNTEVVSIIHCVRPQVRPSQGILAIMRVEHKLGKFLFMIMTHLMFLQFVGHYLKIHLPHGVVVWTVCTCYSIDMHMCSTTTHMSGIEILISFIRKRLFVLLIWRGVVYSIKCSLVRLDQELRIRDEINRFRIPPKKNRVRSQNTRSD